MKKQKSVLILGYGVTGKACVEYFLSKKYQVFVYAKDTENIEGVNLISSVEEVLKNRIKLCVTSPGINMKKDLFCLHLKRFGIQVVTELEYSLKNIKGKTIAVTGTNGKSTTATLIHELLKQKYPCVLAGNIGTPLISQIDHISRKTKVVLEVSSFMLENMNNFCFDVSCLLNLTPDHENWHGGVEDYYQAKLKVFLGQTKKQVAVLNFDDKTVFDRTRHINSRALYFSKTETVKGCFERAGKLCYYDENFDDIMSVKDVGLRGEKNLENILCAVTVAKYFEVNDKTISSVVSNFKPLRHRIEFVGEKDGVLYFNDSKATNISSTLCALGGFEKNVILMLGGQAKQQNFDNLFKKRFQNVKFFVIYGEDHEIIEKSLKKFNKKQNFVLMKTFDEAFEQARSNATAGDVVLLSPACASFDEFKNFEERGDRFCEKVKQI